MLVVVQLGEQCWVLELSPWLGWRLASLGEQWQLAGAGLPWVWMVQGRPLRSASIEPLRADVHLLLPG